MGAFAGIAVLGVGSTAVALAATHSSGVQSAAGTVCQTLPAGASSPPGSPTSTVSAGANSGVASASSSPTQLCVDAEPVAGTVQAGQNAVYKISVWPLNGPVNAITVQISLSTVDSSPAYPAPAFIICGNGAGTQSCVVGPMTTGQTTVLEAEVAVPKSAPSGDSATLTATATGAASGATTTGSASSLATVNVTAAPPPPPPPTHHPGGSGHSSHHSAGSGSGSGSGSGLGSGGLGSGSPIGNLPLPGAGVTTAGSPSTTAGNPVGLFPTINPSSGTGASNARRAGSHGHTGPYRARTVADVLPLTGGLVGSQVAGLVVLALGVILAVARVSLRKPRSSAGKAGK